MYPNRAGHTKSTSIRISSVQTNNGSPKICTKNSIKRRYRSIINENQINYINTDLLPVYTEGKGKWSAGKNKRTNEDKWTQMDKGNRKIHEEVGIGYKRLRTEKAENIKEEIKKWDTKLGT